MFPQLRPGPSGSPRAVAAHQRARLHAAVIEACARHGYAGTTARELAGLAGVSTKALYNHFDSKEACFLATFELIVQQATGRISAAYRGGAGGEPDPAGGLCRAFDAFGEELVERPAESRLALVEVLALGPSAQPRIDRAEGLFAAMIASSLAQGTEGAVVPPRIARALVGGLWFVARTRLLGAAPPSIEACGAELARWLAAYRMPGGSRLPAPRPQRRGAALAARPSDLAGSPRARMLQAAAAIVARGGYAALSPAEIADAAGVTASTFDAEFEDARACFFAMLEWLSAGALADSLRASEGAPSWARSVCRAVEALFARLARDPALARAALLDVFAIGSVGAERSAALLRGFAAVLARRAPEAGRPAPLTAEAIVGSVWSIAHRCLLLGQPRALPASSTRAAFVVLAPVVGADAALASIVAELDRPEPAIRR